MNIYIREVVEKLSSSGVEVDVFTRDHDRKNEIEAHLSKLNVKYIKAGDNSLDKIGTFNHIDEFVQGVDDYRTQNKINYDLIFAHYWLSGCSIIKTQENMESSSDNNISYYARNQARSLSLQY